MSIGVSKMSERNIRVGILTFHRAYNYGALLQAYALQKTIRRFGAKCDIIDYWSEEKRKSHTLFKINSQMGAKGNLAKLVKDVYRFRKNKNFNRFMNYQSMLSNIKYSTIEQLREMDRLSLYDVYIVGSDQVWNVENNLGEEAFLLTFTDDNKKKCSYAASFGSAEIDSELEQKYMHELSKFRIISIREEDALERFSFLKRYGAISVLDPTFLLEKDVYICLASKRIIKQKYAFLYTIPKDNQLREYARKFCRQNNLVLIDSKKTISFFINSKPEDFLSYFSNAEFIFTNSFHGTVFSIIMKKDFATEINLHNKSINNRIKNLLAELDLLDRDIDSPDYNALKEIDYDIVEDKIESMREVSFGVLENIINYIEE